jgi:hypothetical protein
LQIIDTSRDRNRETEGSIFCVLNRVNFGNVDKTKAFFVSSRTIVVNFVVLFLKKTVLPTFDETNVTLLLQVTLILHRLIAFVVHVGLF